MQLQRRRTVVKYTEYFEIIQGFKLLREHCDQDPHDPGGRALQECHLTGLQAYERKCPLAPQQREQNHGLQPLSWRQGPDRSYSCEGEWIAG